ncbi:sarcosine oxidase subunit gamma family protein [Xinfangfangia sp. CPCC 101601]|uniref:Sarcosine oxidase subunit gamma family protein n=1 Tax=Pseudogemmobacter lacusdianii TaxID=3069608 RepID=A0ABU0W1M2_9RHOB|nr:sarcosine oxidase subunit gamma family protein [Xinfangfangia sp. CPCC 101601]MDQ2067909.1 sarcosine oxidase subunit gamma family protein [Xinfangfangia sp. CPCC 101601]
MLDHGKNWDVAPDWATAELNVAGVTIRSLDLAETALVSGDLAAFAATSGLDAEGAGAFGEATGERYTVRLARDRLLLVGPLPEAVTESWNAAGFAVTATGGMDHVFTLSGAGLAALLARATTVDPAIGSRSAMIGFGGVPAVVYRHAGSDALRLHVERSLAAYLWTWLQTALKA